MLNLQPSTLRFWESKFTLIKPRRNSHGTRFYTPNDIEVIRMIHYLVKDRGLKLEAAEDEIRRNRSGISKKYEAVKRLEEVRLQLENLMEALDGRAAVLRRATRAAIEAEHKAAEHKATAENKEAETVATPVAVPEEITPAPRKRRKHRPEDDMPSLF